MTVLRQFDWPEKLFYRDRDISETGSREVSGRGTMLQHMCCRPPEPEAGIHQVQETGSREKNLAITKREAGSCESSSLVVPAGHDPATP